MMFQELSTIEEYESLIDTIPRGRLSPLLSPAGKEVGFGMLYSVYPFNEENVIELFTDNYHVVNNCEVLESFRGLAADAIDHGGVIQIAERRGSMWAYYWREAGKKAGEFKFGARITNSINGKLRFCVEPMMLRVTCGNGATVRLLSEAERFLHISQRSKEIDTLINSPEIISGVLDEYLEHYQALEDISDTQEQIRQLKTKKIFSDRFIEKYEEEWGAIQNMQDVYNAVTYRGSHKGELLYDDTILAAAEMIMLAPTTP